MFTVVVGVVNEQVRKDMGRRFTVRNNAETEMREAYRDDSITGCRELNGRNK